MFHAGLALELSRIIWDDRRAEATAGRGRSGRTRPEHPRSARTSRWMRPDGALARGRLIGAPSAAGDDPWWAWRVVEPDTEYLRRRAAA
jgi:hypothetical protein